MLTYTGVTNFQKKQSSFLAHPVYRVHHQGYRIEKLDMSFAKYTRSRMVRRRLKGSFVQNYYDEIFE